jgi:hypothetical protein
MMFNRNHIHTNVDVHIRQTVKTLQIVQTLLNYNYIVGYFTESKLNK